MPELIEHFSQASKYNLFSDVLQTNEMTSQYEKSLTGLQQDLSQLEIYNLFSDALQIKPDDGAI